MVIEHTDEIKGFLDIFSQKDSIILPIFNNNTLHPLNNTLCIIIVKIFKCDEFFILPFNHNEAVNLNMDFLDMLNVSTTRKFIYNKKEFLHIKNLNNLIDINLLQYLNTNKTLEYNIPLTGSEIVIRRNFNYVKNLNCAVPILKLFEKYKEFIIGLENTVKNFEDYGNEKCFEFLNNDVIESLKFLEEAGLHVDRKLFDKYFESNKHINSDDIVYSEYNMFTATGRPSNRFGNVNFNALDKNNGERSCFNSRFEHGGLILMDYDGYHLRLIGKEIGFKFPETSAHRYLGKQYYGKEELNDDEYEESKKITFQLLYGGVDKEIANAIPFFGMMENFINSLWNQFQTKGYVETLISKKKIYKYNFPDMNKRKLFNYILQNTELEHSVVVIKRLSRFLNDYKTKLILYTYDSFLFDLCADDGKELLPQLKRIMENDEYPVKIYFGKNYDDMINISDKI
jgi:DNA polymerase I-like protein with 3'-5' exonuclease and polymerase domains